MPRLLFISLEFTAATFSGNGIYAAGQVQALTVHGCRVLVLAGKPSGQERSTGRPHADIAEIELPHWGTLDRSCSWQAFAKGCRQPTIVQRIVDFRPDAVLGVDWSALPAFEALHASLVAEDMQLPYVYMNYRVYARTALPADAEWMKGMELRAMEIAAVTIALSKSDADFLRQLVLRQSHKHVEVLLPALRADMAALPLPADIQGSTAAKVGSCASHSAAAVRSDKCQRRKYMTCCVRLSPEKEPDRFVNLVEALHRKAVLNRLQVIPLLIGASKTPYADGIKSRLRRCGAQCEIVEQFLGPTELAQIFSQTMLNIHPCLYDAFGMSIVEAAAQGAPSLTNTGGSIGATDLLQSSAGEVVTLDLGLPTQDLALKVAVLLADQNHLQEADPIQGSCNPLRYGKH
ncbi:hypothetical protein WJX84_004656 [Apatococcus fuscideae]|uniref:Glycosyl transferase family 1 domain-containing protein n=1 Tax=Apatococcus fuscideae TaxID=2026836 RepID=A0AAW1T3Y6_9CHLO